MSKQSVPNLSQLAKILGVNRGTLARYAEAGCPIIKTVSGEYLIAPTVWWYGRMMQRRQLRKFFRNLELPKNIAESLETIIDDHEKAFPLWIEEKHS